MTILNIISTQDFEEILNKYDTVIFDFWATWCGPCRMLLSVLDETAPDLPKNSIIAKINVDEAQEICAKFDIQSVPTLMLFKNKNQIAQKTGFISKNNLLAWINETL